MDFEGQYLEFDEYEELGGSLPETPFNILEFEARRKIDEKTFGRLKEMDTKKIPLEVKMCVFALVNTLQSYSLDSTSSKNKNIASESTDGYSVSYVAGSQVQEIVKSKSAELNDIIKNYLLNVIVNEEHILYVGVK